MCPALAGRFFTTEPPCCCCLVIKLCTTICGPKDCSKPAFSILPYFLELAQTHVHQVGDAIQPSHPLSSPSPPASIFPSIRVFSSESVLYIRWPKYWSFSFSVSPSNEYSGQVDPSTYQSLCDSVSPFINWVQ